MGWVIKDGQGSLYRTMDQGMPKWTGFKENALHFSRRQDAELFAAEDEDAGFVKMEPLSHEWTEFFNQLSPAEAERLWLLVEEMGEALQAIGKIGRHGYDSAHPDNVVGGSNNRGDLQKELGHVIRIMQMLRADNDISWGAVLDASDKKLISMKPYLHHQSSTKEP